VGTSPTERFFLFDIETVRDEAIVARFPAKTQSATIPPPIGNQVVAISYVFARTEGTGHARHLSVESCGSFGDETSSEVEVLEAFWEALSTAPVVITWNGRAFDVPVLLHRSFYHGVAARPWFEHGGINRYSNYGYRYGDRHIDLMDVMADYGAVRYYGLNLTAEIVGLPGKIGGHGSEVATMYAAKAIRKIRAYCECDCLNLFGIFLRWSLLTGRLSTGEFDRSIALFKAFIDGQSLDKAHIRTFRDAWSDALSLA
jgi:predicted PolB exonuclease-like 3'-5' exonuclease